MDRCPELLPPEEGTLSIPAVVPGLRASSGPAQPQVHLLPRWRALFPTIGVKNAATKSPRTFSLQVLLSLFSILVKLFYCPSVAKDGPGWKN